MNKSGYIIVNKGPHKVGLQSDDGVEIVPCRYDKILDYDDDGYIRLIKNGCYSTIDLKGSTFISFSRRLTHLGVFYGGTARARKSDMWGLVDCKGNNVTKFTYKNICAHHGNGYVAETDNGEKGFLTENGKFKPFNKKIKTVPHKVFSKDLFLYALQGMTTYSVKPYKFYYMDTDAPINFEDTYKKGDVIRAGRFVDVPDNLLRPVTRTRFIIASTGFPDAEFLDRMIPDSKNIMCKGSIIHPNTYFIVEDVYCYAGVTQVLLLQIPIEAVSLAKKYSVDISTAIFEDRYGDDFCDIARRDLQKKLATMVHGKSLSDYWINMMYQPIGLDSDMNPVPFESERLIYGDREKSLFEHCAGLYLNEGKSEWNEEKFMKEEKN